MYEPPTGSDWLLPLGLRPNIDGRRSAAQSSAMLSEARVEARPLTQMRPAGRPGMPSAATSRRQPLPRPFHLVAVLALARLVAVGRFNRAARGIDTIPSHASQYGDAGVSDHSTGRRLQH
jgi:hypothetical protein